STSSPPVNTSPETESRTDAAASALESGGTISGMRPALSSAVTYAAVSRTRLVSPSGRMLAVTATVQAGTGLRADDTCDLSSTGYMGIAARRRVGDYGTASKPE